MKYVQSQSLLNEVWFPTPLLVFEKDYNLPESQSLLNEVWFPTTAHIENITI